MERRNHIFVKKTESFDPNKKKDVSNYFENWESLLKTTRTQEIISTLWWKEDAFVWHILHWNDGVSVSSITIKVLPGEHRESHSSTRKHTHSTSSTSNKPEMRFRTTPREFFFIPFESFESLWLTRLNHVWSTFESRLNQAFPRIFRVQFEP